MPQPLIDVLDESTITPLMAANRAAAAQRSATAKRAWERAKSQAYTVNPNTITFGVEIECFMPTANALALQLVVGNYHNGTACPSTLDPLGAGWKCEQDGSITRSNPSGYVAVEFVSPVLCGLSGYTELNRFMQLIERHGAVVNRSCGVHVSVGLASIVGGDAYGSVICNERVREFVRRLLHFVSIHENGLMQIGGRHSRVNNQYCRSIKGRFSDIKKSCSLQTYWESITQQGRYTTVNLQHSRSNNARVEFRVFGGTVNPLKVLGYVSVALGIMHKAATAPVAPKAKVAGGFLPDVIADRKGVLRLHVALWTRYAEEKFGLPDGVWAKWGKRILKNQRWNAKRFIGGLPTDNIDQQA